MLSDVFFSRRPLPRLSTWKTLAAQDMDSYSIWTERVTPLLDAIGYPDAEQGILTNESRHILRKTISILVLCEPDCPPAVHMPLDMIPQRWAGRLDAWGLARYAHLSYRPYQFHAVKPDACQFDPNLPSLYHRSTTVTQYYFDTLAKHYEFYSSRSHRNYNDLCE